MRHGWFWVVLLVFGWGAGVEAQGPHLSVERFGEGLRVRNGGTQRLAPDGMLLLKSSTVVFEREGWSLGALSGGRSVDIEPRPRFLDGACEGGALAIADGENVPRLEYGPFTWSSPQVEFDLEVLEADEGWKTVRLRFRADRPLEGFQIMAEVPEGWSVDRESVDCGALGRPGAGGCLWTRPVKAGVVSARMASGGVGGALALVAESKDGCRRKVSASF